MKIRPFEPRDRDGVIELWRACELTRPWNDPGRDIDRKQAVQPELFLLGFDGDALWLQCLWRLTLMGVGEQQALRH